MPSTARRAPAEGTFSWVAVAAIALGVLVFNLWLAYGAASPGPLFGSLSVNAAVNIHAGQAPRLGPDAVHPGSVIQCESNGVRVSAVVPALGRLVSLHIDASVGPGATIRIRTLPDGTVGASCTT